MNLRTLSLAVALLTTLTSGAAAATAVAPGGKTLGVGIELGAPTNINLKFMVTPDQGVVVGVGGGIWYDLSLSLHADYLWHPLVASFDAGTFSAYIGGGAWTSIGYGGAHFGYYQPYFAGVQPLAIGARLPLGLSLAFNAIPVEIFGEIVPSVQLFPGIGVFGQGGIGARLYF